MDLPDYKLGKEGDLDAFTADYPDWVYFVEQECRVSTAGMVGMWTWEERRDLLNWMLEEGILRAEDDRLVPVEGSEDGAHTGEAGDDPRTLNEAEGAEQLTEV